VHHQTVPPSARPSRCRDAAGWIAVCLLLGACAAPSPVSAPPATETGALVDVADLTPDGPDSAPQPAADAPKPKRGFLGFLRRDKGDAAAAPQSDAPDLAPATPLPPTEVAETEDLPAAADPPDAVADPPRSGRLFGFLSRRSDNNAPPSPGVTEPGSATVFGADVLLPFGQVVKACGLGKREMGTEVVRSQGSGAFRLYDTAPSSTAPRAQFLTGFKDGCARQFTASLALFGSAEVHEATRYADSNKKPYSSTDEAYERIKTRVCGVRKGAFCPENKIDKLSRDTAFVSIYRTFGGNDAWLELFLNKGELVAQQTLAP
jgi:hypothetical protein